MTPRTGPHWDLLEAALTDTRSGAFAAAIEKLTVILGDQQTSPALVENALYHRAGAKRHLGDTSGAFADYDRVLSRPIVTPNLETAALYDRATTKIVAQDFAGAASDYTMLLTRPALDVSARAWTLINRSAAYRGVGNVTDAKADCDAVLSMVDAPGDQRRKALLSLGELYREEGRLDEAIEAFAKGYEAYDMSPGATEPNDVLAVIADLYIDANNLSQAIITLNRLLARTDLTGTQRARALLRRAFVKAESGDKHAARVDARAVLKMRVIPEGYAQQAQRFLD